jgi:asparagine synthase (glutamine-hydrolysing)
MLGRATSSLAHRGPDDMGLWFDEEAGIALGHRRLSIIDTSDEGHQPMHSACRQYVIAFNGEIYNFKELRRELEELGCVFRGHSDTEIMLSAIERWGVLVSLERFIGMFAFALWDRKERALYLVRDRLGIKPLYYGWVGKTFVFASELKAISVHPNFQGEINRNAVALLMRYNYVPAPYSIYNGIYKLLPGNVIIFRNDKIKEQVYWSAKSVVEDGTRNTFEGSVEEAIREVDKLMRDAVKIHMLSDVPLGAFLSGGIDSSTVTALMQIQSARPIKTFSIGFAEDEYNEAAYAKEVARYLGTDHTEFYVRWEDALEIIPKLSEIYDEPFSDSSQIPTYLLSKLAHEHVTVCLSGDGGDELFGGYNRYFWGRSIWQKTGWMGPEIQKLFSGLLTLVSPEVWDTLFRMMNHLLPRKLRQKTAGDKLHKLAEVLGGQTPEELYYRLISLWNEPSKIVKYSVEPETIITDKNQWAELFDFTQKMMFFDLVSYLPDDILTKVDRASMAVSLEVRVPMLDHRMVELAWRLPLSMKIKNRQGKWLLKKILSQYIPKKLIDRPKMGFGIPIHDWLRGPLRDWAENLIDESRLKNEGYFNHKEIRNKWKEHLCGRRNWQYHLWNILMFQL